MKKIKNKRKLFNTIFLSFVTFLLLLSFIMAKPYLDGSYKINSKPKTEDKKVEEPKEKVYALSLAMVGDALIHDSVYNDARTNDGYDFSKMLTYINEYTKDFDLKFYNQETPIGGDQWPYASYPCFNTPKEFALNMLDIGFNLVNLATNHTLDGRRMGVDGAYYCTSPSTGATNSAKFWEEQDVYAVGNYTSFEKQDEIIIKEKNGIKYALLGYTWSTNGIPVPKGEEYLVNIYSDEQAKKDIEAVRDLVDILIVSMHWGNEYTHTPTNGQQEQANYLASLGVDIIIGHHPHVVEPVTWIDKTLVIYSLGNFISAQLQNENYNKMVGLMTMLDITKRVNGNNVEIEISNVKNELLYTYYKNSRDFKVIPFSMLTSEYLPNYKNVYETYKNVIQKYDSSMEVVALKED